MCVRTSCRRGSIRRNALSHQHVAVLCLPSHKIWVHARKFARNVAQTPLLHRAFALIDPPLVKEGRRVVVEDPAGLARLAAKAVEHYLPRGRVVISIERVEHVASSRNVNPLDLGSPPGHDPYARGGVLDELNRRLPGQKDAGEVERDREVEEDCAARRDGHVVRHHPAVKVANPN